VTIERWNGKKNEQIASAAGVYNEERKKNHREPGVGSKSNFLKGPNEK